jgi:CRISPR-associated endoribonuclease Cas6
MLDLANHSTVVRTTPYKFKREGFVPYKPSERSRENVAPKIEEGETIESQES